MNNEIIIHSSLFIVHYSLLLFINSNALNLIFNQIYFMKKLFLLLLTFVALSINMQAQKYLTPQFAGIDVKANVPYGSNFTVLTLSVPSIAHTTRFEPLICDIYQPSGDTTSSATRPLVIYVTAGNFLPRNVRGEPWGDKSDSSATEICTRLAKLGYVAASATYRSGWNPIASTQTERNATLLQATYRGIQDIRSCVRFFKANAGFYKIDTNKIVIWGEGTGGYLSLAVNCLNDYNKVVSTVQPAGKFLTKNPTDTTKLIPFVVQAVHGDIEGKVLTIVPVAGFGIPVGDTTCVPNTVGPSSKIAMSINMGGALGDISWLDNTSVPTICIQAPHDVYAPYTSFVLQVPIGGGKSLPVVEVQGSYLISNRADSIGVNAPFSKITAAYDPYKGFSGTRSALVGAGSKNSSGLFPILGQSTLDSSPWRWWSLTDTLANHKGNDSTNLAGSPGMSRAKAVKYIDSIMIFVTPRLCAGLNLPCKGVVTSTEDLLQASATKLMVSPNPAISAITFESEVFNPMHAIEIYDLSGRQMVQINNINSAVYNLQRNAIPSGMYIAKVKFEGGILTKKVLFQD